MVITRCPHGSMRGIHGLSVVVPWELSGAIVCYRELSRSSEDAAVQGTNNLTTARRTFRALRPGPTRYN